MLKSSLLAKAFNTGRTAPRPLHSLRCVAVAKLLAMGPL